MQHIKNFIYFGVNLLQFSFMSVGSKFAVSFFTALEYHPVDFENCCQQGGKAGAMHAVNSIDLEYLDRNRTNAGILHPDLDPMAADIRYGFRSIRGELPHNCSGVAREGDKWGHTRRPWGRTSTLFAVI